MSNILEITDLHATIGDTPILKGINLTIKEGEIHAIMGKNGSGKSTLAKIIAGHEAYKVTDGDIKFNGISILELAPEERSRKGIFLGFQYPVEIPGVSNADFLRLSCNSRRKEKGEPEMEPLEFFEYINKKLEIVEMTPNFLNRNVNEGFSGGEKKRNEVLQMLLLEPSFGVLDETDSGLDIDALQIVAKGVESLRSPERSFLVITHYQRLLDYIKPDFVHVLADGQIIHSGDASLALTLEKQGYGWLTEKEGA